MGKTFFFIVAIFVAQGCHFSFHSGQYQAANRIISSLKTEGGRSELRPNWLLSWNGFLLPTTAVNVAKETWFVGENDMVLSFDGWQLTRINNLMPTGINVTIELEESNMVIKGNDIDVVTYKCDEWAKKNMAITGNTVFLQNCSNVDYSFSNLIVVDKQGKIVKLSFSIYPDYPPVSLELAAL